MVKKQQIDWLLFAIAAGLAIFGSVMVYSASAMISLKETQDQSQYAYFYKQFGFTVVGIAAMFFVSRIDYHLFDNKYVIFGLLGITVVLLLLVFGFPKVNGARRWIRIAGFSFQPSEMTKIVLPLFLAWFLTKKEHVVGEIRSTLLPCLAALVVLGGLVFAGPDLGTTIVLCGIFSAVYFAAGARIIHIAAVGGAMGAVGALALIVAPWRLERVMAFLDPYKYADDAGYQVVQSLYAIGSGGILGEGFAKGQQKLFYLPYPYSDFIFSVVGEELGLIGTLAVVAAFGFLLWRGARTAFQAPDRFGMLLAIGITTGIVVQALFNISVVTSILPAKGIPLPFISYGGTSVLVTLFAVGLLLSISRFSGATAPERSPDSVSMYKRKGKTRFA
jgi:cell division protein FtsW